jgi:hypothetical protein
MGVQIINKDISVVSSIIGKPKASINNVINTSGWAAPIPFVPGDFNFTDTTVNPYTSNTVTFTKSGTLYIYGTSDGNKDWIASVYLNGSATALKAYITAADAITYKQTGGGSSVAFMYFGDYMVVDVNIGNTMYFNISASGPPFPSTGTITFSINNFSNNGGTVIDTFTSTLSGCYLTTATVQFKGLLDDGPELTAMRALREHYRGDVYYDDLIAEYYESSVAIIQGIDNSLDPSVDYEFIYQSVLKVKDYVDQSMWAEGWDEYYETYLTLKAKYI